MKISKTLLAAAMLMAAATSYATDAKHTSCTNEATFAKSVALSRNAGMPAHEILKNVNQQPYIGVKTRKIAEGIPKRVAAGIVANVYDAQELSPDQHADLAYQACQNDAA